jgi:hypothetical protein
MRNQKDRTMQKSKPWMFLLCIITAGTNAQDALPYYEIPEAPENYLATTVVARLIDGLGFRYYWATEGLRDEDLAFRPSEAARTTAETIDHIHGLTKVILNSALKQPNTREEPVEMSFEDKRAETLQMLKQAADIFRESEDLGAFTVVFNQGETSNEFPFWNQINGPISDALWHCGQVVTHRRSSGNPFNSKVSVFSGKVRD